MTLSRSAAGAPKPVIGALDETVMTNGQQGRVYAFAGATPALLYTLDSPNGVSNGNFGYALAAGDVNADGAEDVVVGAAFETASGNMGQGRTYAFSGSLPASVGGIAEQPDLARSRLPTANAPRDTRTLLGVCAIAIMFAIAVDALSWRRTARQ